MSSTLMNMGYSITFYPTGHMPSGEKSATEEKLRKGRITVLVAANMDGNEKLPLLVIGRSEKPHSFKNIKSFPCKYRHNKTAWMTCILFEEFLQTLNAKMAAKNRNILLFIDKCAAHPKNISPCLMFVWSFCLQT
jgi:hypothetical protein